MGERITDQSSTVNWGISAHPLSLFPARKPAGKRLRPFFAKMGFASRSREWAEKATQLLAGAAVMGVTGGAGMGIGRRAALEIAGTRKGKDGDQLLDLAAALLAANLVL
jgi:hypothetical protein